MCPIDSRVHGHQRELHTEFISMNNFPPGVLPSLEPSKESGSTFSPGAVAAILSSVMVVLLIALLIVSGWLLRRHKKRKSKRLNLL